VPSRAMLTLTDVANPIGAVCRQTTEAHFHQPVSVWSVGVGTNTADRNFVDRFSAPMFTAILLLLIASMIDAY